MNIFKYFFNRAQFRRDKLESAYWRGHQCAHAILLHLAEDKVVAQTARLRGLANGAFNRTEFEAAFDHGVLDACDEAERELGAP